MQHWDRAFAVVLRAATIAGAVVQLPEITKSSRCMNPDPENFENLRKLLALKRHEQPPPGYFNRLPDTILSRIKAGDQPSESFWERLLPRVILRPAFAYGFGLAACAMLAKDSLAEG